MKKYLLLTTVFNTSVGLFSHTFAAQDDNSLDAPHTSFSIHKKEALPDNGEVPSGSKLAVINSWKDTWLTCLKPDGVSGDQQFNDVDWKQISLILNVESEDHINNYFTFLKNSGALEKSKNSSEILDILNVLKGYSDDQLKTITTDIFEKCQNGNQVAYVLKVLKIYIDEQLRDVIALVKSSGLWEECQKGDQVAHIFKILRRCPEKQRGAIITLINSLVMCQQISGQ